MSRSILRILRGKKVYLGLTAAAFIVVIVISMIFFLQPPASIIYDLPKSPGTFNWNTGNYFNSTHEVGDVTTGHFGTLSLECYIGGYTSPGLVESVTFSVNVSTGVYDNPANSSNEITIFGLWVNDTSQVDVNAGTQVVMFSFNGYIRCWNCTNQNYNWVGYGDPPAVNFFVPNSGAKQCASLIGLIWFFSPGHSSNIQICAESMFSGSNPGTRDYVYSTVNLDMSA
jgi:hypothetical protein